MKGLYVLQMGCGNLDLAVFGVFASAGRAGHFEDAITVPLQKLMQIKQQQQLHQQWQLFQLTQTIILALADSKWKLL